MNKQYVKESVQKMIWACADTGATQRKTFGAGRHSQGIIVEVQGISWGWQPGGTGSGVEFSVRLYGPIAEFETAVAAVEEITGRQRWSPVDGAEQGYIIYDPPEEASE